MRSSVKRKSFYLGTGVVVVAAILPATLCTKVNTNTHAHKLGLHNYQGKLKRHVRYAITHSYINSFTNATITIAAKTTLTVAHFI